MKHSLQLLSSRIYFALVALFAFASAYTARAADEGTIGFAGNNNTGGCISGGSWTANNRWRTGTSPNYSCSSGNTTWDSGNTGKAVIGWNAPNFVVTGPSTASWAYPYGIDFLADNCWISGGYLNLNIASTPVSVVASATCTISAVLQGLSKGMDKTGSGALELKAVNTYSGATTVSAGALVLQTVGSLANSAVTVQTSAANKFRVKVITSGGQTTVKSLTYAVAGILDFEWLSGAVPSTTTATLNIPGAGGDLSFSASPTVNIIHNSQIPNATVSYPLISYGGADPANAPSLGVITPALSGATATLTIRSKVLYLDVTSTASVAELNWGTSGNGIWDVGNSLNTTWKDSTTHAGTYYQEASNPGDKVVFEDTDSGGGDHTVTLDTTVTPSSVTVNSAYAYTISGSGGITGGIGLSKQGTGTLTLDLNNSYSGVTTVSAGTLAIGAGGTRGSVAGNIADNGALIFNRSDAWAYSGVISGSGDLTKTGAGTLTLSAPNHTLGTGSLTVSEGTMIFSAGPSITCGSITVSGGATLTTGGTAVSCSGNVSTGGTLNLRGINTIGGNISVNSGGNLICDFDSRSFGTTATIIVNNGGQIDLQFDGSSSQTISRPLQLNGTGNSGGGALQWNDGPQNLTGGTMIWSGAITLNGNSKIANNLAAENRNFTLNGGISLGGNVLTLVGGTMTLSTTSISDAGSLVFAPSANRTHTLNTAATSVTSVTMNGAGTLKLGAADLINDATSVLLSSGTFDLNGYSETIGTLGGSGNVLNANGTLTINAPAGEIYSGAISGSGGLAKNGSGTWTLTGANSYTGDTTVSAGTLALGVGGTLSSSANIIVGTAAASTAILDASAAGITIGSGRTLKGHGTVNGIVTLSGGTLAPGTSIGTLTLGASPSLGGTLAMELNKAGAVLSCDRLALGGNSITYGGVLSVTHTGDALVSGDSFTLVTAGSFVAGNWFSSVSLPGLTAGLCWDTNNLATSGVLDVYTFSSTPLALSTTAGTAATIAAGKIASHVSSGKAASAYPGGWSAVVTTAAKSGSSVVVDGDGSFTYTPGATANADGSDSFTLTLGDGHGAQTLEVSVTVNQVNSGATLTGVDNGSGHYTITTSGLPSHTYDVQANTDGTGVWEDIGAATAASNGVVSWTDPDLISAHTSRVYRLAQQ